MECRTVTYPGIPSIWRNFPPRALIADGAKTGTPASFCSGASGWATRPTDEQIYL